MSREGDMPPRRRTRDECTTLAEGERIGRFLVLRDVDGRLHAVSAGVIGAMCECDEGTLIMLPGGRMVQVSRPLEVLLAWLDGRGP